MCEKIRRYGRIFIGKERRERKKKEEREKNCAIGNGSLIIIFLIFLQAGLTRPAGPAGEAGREEDRERALEALERAVRAGFKDWRKIHRDPDLEPFQEEERYQALMKEE